MDIEEIEIEGQLITVSPPVSNINVNDARVTYEDSTGFSEASFSTHAIADQFATVISNL